MGLVRGWVMDGEVEGRDGALVSDVMTSIYTVPVLGPLRGSWRSIGRHNVASLAFGWRYQVRSVYKTLEASVERSRRTFGFNPDLTGLCNFMQGVARVARDIGNNVLRMEGPHQEIGGRIYPIHEAGQRAAAVAGFTTAETKKSSARLRHASAEWSRRVSEKVKAMEAKKRNSTPWSPYATC